jgi:hypothetical protein
MCNHLKVGHCDKCGETKEVFKMEEVRLDVSGEAIPYNEYMLCRDCFIKRITEKAVKLEKEGV